MSSELFKDAIFLEKMRKVKENKGLVFDSKIDLARALDVGIHYVKDYMEFFTSEGFAIKGRIKRYKAPEFLKKISKLKSEGNVIFNSIREFAEHIKEDESALSNYRSEIIKLGITFNYVPQKKEQKPLDTVLTEENIKTIENFTKPEELIFKSYNDFIRKIGIKSNILTKSDKNFLMSKGITISNDPKYREELLVLKIRNFIKANKTVFNGINHFAREAEFSLPFIKHRLEILDKYGITYDYIHIPKIKDEKFLNKIENLIKNDELVYDSPDELVTKLNENLGAKSQESIKYLSKKGFLFFSKLTGSSTINKKEKETLKRYLSNKLKELNNNGVFAAKNPAEAAKLFNITREFFIKDCLDILKNLGFFISITSQTNENTTPNYHILSSKLNSKNIKIDSVEGFIELGQEFFNLPINVNRIELEPIVVSNKTFKKFTQKEINDIVGLASLQLSEEDLDSFSLPEIKYQILLNGYYFSSETVLRSLSILGELCTEETIHTRIRLAQKLTKTEHLSIDFRKALPLLNDNEEGDVIILDSIKNKMFTHWQDYILFSAKNNLIPKTVSRAEINTESLRTIDDLLLVNKQIGKVLFLEEDFNDFRSLNFDGVLALLMFCSEKSSHIEEKYRSLKSFLFGFFLWLNKEKKALFHCKLLKFNGNGYLPSMCEIIFKKHAVFLAHDKVKESEELSEIKKKRFNSKVLDLHKYLLASSIKHDADLSLIPKDEISPYMIFAIQEGPSGAISHITYTKDLLTYSNNQNVLYVKEETTIREIFINIIRKKRISANVLNNYKELINEIIKIIEFDSEEQKRSKQYIRSFVSDTVMLLEFLDTFPKKLSKEELSKAFNFINKAEDIKTMSDWAKETNYESRFRSATFKYSVLFNEIPEENEYYHVYNSKWVLSTKSISKGRRLIRNGFEYPIYITFQHMAINHPPKTLDFPIKRTSPSGEQLDLSWWKHEETNPIIAICNWIVSKLPRRSTHIRSLDVNTFLTYDDDGSLTGFYFNTDKNQSKGANNRIIPIFLLNILFTKEELTLIQNYVKYIKEAYGHYSPVPYENGGDYELIQPLFPDPEQNNILRKTYLRGMYVKTMVKTQFKVRELAKNGEFNGLYNDEIRDRKIQYLSKCTLVLEHNRKSIQGKIKEITEDVESLGYTTSNWYNYYKTPDGIHNMRHAGASALLTREGLTLLHIKTITGHTSIDILANVYIKINENSTRLAVENISQTMAQYINNPIKASSEFISKKLMPLTYSNDPNAIKDELFKNGFMSLSRIVTERDISIYGSKMEQKKYVANENMVDDGITIAAKFHPDTYEEFNHGICTIGKRCPVESNGECCLCPHLIFNAVHIEGILYKYQKTMIEMKMLQDKLKIAFKEGNLSNRTELQKSHNHKTLEFIGWSEMIQKVSNQLQHPEAIRNNNGKKKEIIKSEKASQFFFTRAIEMDEMSLEALSTASRLNIKEIFTDHLTNSISYKILMNGVKNNDKDLIQKMEKEGIESIIRSYGLEAIEDRKGFIDSLMSPRSDLNALEPYNQNKISDEAEIVLLLD